MKECMLFLRILTLHGLNWKRDPFPSAIHSYLLVIISPRYEIAFLAIDVHRPNISLLFPFDSTFNGSYRGWERGMESHGKGTQRPFHFVPLLSPIRSQPHPMSARIG